MEKKIYAKSNGETLAEHTQKLLLALNNLVNTYPEFFKCDLAIYELMSKSHDLGKVNTMFQNKMKAFANCEGGGDNNLKYLYDNEGIKELPHGYISAIAMPPYNELASIYGEDVASVMITAVANHHTRQVRNMQGELISAKSIRQIAKQEIEYYNLTADQKLPINPSNFIKLIVKSQEELSKGVDKNLMYKYIKYKGILNKLDYVASSDSETIEIPPENICENVLNYFNSNNYSLNDCQKFMLDNQNENIIVTASTGIGKTEASLLWAGESKTFYTLPLKVAINSIYERILQNDYSNKEKTTFLHSDTFEMLLEQNQSYKDSKLIYESSRNLSYPLTVCTIDQLFKFVFLAMGSEIFPATLSYSKIIIDEIQSYCPSVLACLVKGVEIISKMGGKFCIMTATLPPFIIDHFNKQKIPFKTSNVFYKKSHAHAQNIIRHNISLKMGEIDYELINSLSQNKKVLVVVNTVAKAQEVYCELKNILNVPINLLHSRFKQVDKKQKERQILSFTDKQNKSLGVWVSTQIVEASLDIDFDCIITEFCTADSLLQRLGRCYRSRDYDSAEPNCYIFNTGNGMGKIYDKDIFDFSWQELSNIGDGLFAEDQKIIYFNKVYSLNNIENTKYYTEFKDRLYFLNGLNIKDFDKKEADEKFREIRNVSLITEQDYNENIELIENIKRGENVYINLSKLRKLSINVSLNSIKFGKDKFTATDIGIKGFFMTNNVYSKEQGLTYSVDDNNFL